MDELSISGDARRLSEEDARHGRFAVREVIHRPGRPNMSRPTPPELLPEQGAADAIVSGVVD
jgi:hypothetical protein